MSDQPKRPEPGTLVIDARPLENILVDFESGTTRGYTRAKPGFDVSRLAFSFGGGGHPAASGCTVKGTLPDVIAQVTPVMKAARRSQLQKGAHSGGAQA